jgi:hypothetical protein
LNELPRRKRTGYPLDDNFHYFAASGGEYNPKGLKREIGYYFERCTTIQSVKMTFGDKNLLHLFHEDFLADPQNNLKMVCDFLNVKSHQDYLEACGKIVIKRSHKTRLSVGWTRELVDLVNDQLPKYPWLKRYSYDS